MHKPADMDHQIVPLTLADYADLAVRLIPRPIWDFLDGGAGDERTLRANVTAFDDFYLRPRVLAGVGVPDTSVSIFGRTWAAPIGIAPMAYHTLAHPEGELATAEAAAGAGLPLIVSTFASRTLEDIAAAARTVPLWLQVYCFRERAWTRELVQRADRAGYGAIVLTVDAPHMGRRLRDIRGAFRLPADVIPANLPAGDYSSPILHSRTEFDPYLDWSVIGWLRSICGLPIVLKGILTAEDSLRALEAGADGIIVSNHGGRQLDGASASIRALPEVAAAVAGRFPVFVDGGVRRGTDVLTAMALGADAVFVGRPVLHGLAAGGSEALTHLLGLLQAEVADAMALTGVSSFADTTPALVGSRHPR
jgi:(S)-3,5-dihydroxyphenylglycine transaminase